MARLTPALDLWLRSCEKECVLFGAPGCDSATQAREPARPARPPEGGSCRFPHLQSQEGVGRLVAFSQPEPLARVSLPLGRGAAGSSRVKQTRAERKCWCFWLFLPSLLPNSLSADGLLSPWPGTPGTAHTPSLVRDTPMSLQGGFGD